jgi:putative transposase
LRPPRPRWTWTPALEQAIASAEALLGGPLHDECVDVETGEVQPLVIVTDNGPAMRSIVVARWFNARPHLKHVRTRHTAPETNGVVERWFASLKYERLYRHYIDDGLILADHVADFLDEFNRIRPHEAIDWQRPLERYLQTPEPSNPTNPDLEQET